MQATSSAKQAVGEAALRLVENGMRLGLGTGSTVDFFLVALARRVQKEGLSIQGVATSQATVRRARELGLPLTTLEEAGELDLAVDGADEVDARFRLIKGGGGALLREKIVASAARQVVILVDESKRVERLGQRFHLPVEILPFGWQVTSKKVAALGATPFLRTGPEGGPFVTDNGNSILDCRFPQGILEPVKLHAALSQIPGVAEVGLFLGLCHVLFVGHADGRVETATCPPA
ncbi:MAG: ribose-5-phosphate isomerase RpiA [Planctomycetota bacterium]